MEIETENRSSVWMGILTITCFCISGALLFVAWDKYQNAHMLSKSQFICTKIEQVGKNMDDVMCVQYTNQKFYKEAVALNKTSEYLVRR